MGKLYGISRRIYDDSDHEVMFRKGEGCFVFDMEGRKYIDLILGYGPAIMGHGNAEFADCVQKAVLEGTVFPSYGEKQIILADRIKKHYKDHQLLAVYQSGSDTLMAALKICRMLTGRKKYIRFGYVGWLEELFDGGLNWHEPINSSLYNQVITKDVVNENAINWNGDDMDAIEKLCRDREVACLIADAYQIDRHPHCNFDKVVELCKENGVLLVLDETKTAGRVAPYGYYKNKYNFDFTVVGKAVGNGIPVSLLLGHDQYQTIRYDALKMAGTYTRDLLSCEAVLATEDIMTANNGYQKVSETGKLLAERLNARLKEIGAADSLFVNVLLNGGILELCFSKELANDYEMRKEFSRALLRNHLIIPDGHCFYICTEHFKVIDQIESSFIQAYKEVYAKDSLLTVKDEFALHT